MGGKKIGVIFAVSKLGEVGEPFRSDVPFFCLKIEFYYLKPFRAVYNADYAMNLRFACLGFHILVSFFYFARLEHRGVVEVEANSFGLLMNICSAVRLQSVRY